MKGLFILGALLAFCATSQGFCLSGSLSCDPLVGHGLLGHGLLGNGFYGHGLNVIKKIPVAVPVIKPAIVKLPVVAPVHTCDTCLNTGCAGTCLTNGCAGTCLTNGCAGACLTKK